MKKLIFLMLVPIFVNAQIDLPIDTSSKLITINRVIKLDTTYSGKLLYSITKEWISDYGLKVKFEDEAGKKISTINVVRFSAGAFTSMPNMRIDYEIKFYFKDGKVKVEFLNYMYENYGPDGSRLVKIGVFNDACGYKGNMEMFFDCKCCKDNFKLLSEFVIKNSNRIIGEFEAYIKKYKARSNEW